MDDILHTIINILKAHERNCGSRPITNSELIAILERAWQEELDNDLKNSMMGG